MSNKYFRIHNTIFKKQYVRQVAFLKRLVKITWLGGQHKCFPLKWECPKDEIAGYMSELSGQTAATPVFTDAKSPTFIQLADFVTIGDTIDWIFFDDRHRCVQIKYLCGKVTNFPVEVALTEDEKTELTDLLNTEAESSSPITVC